MNLELILAKKITVVESITERRLLRFEGKKGREALPAALYAMGFARCRHGLYCEQDWAMISVFRPIWRQSAS